MFYIILLVIIVVAIVVGIGTTLHADKHSNEE